MGEEKRRRRKRIGEDLGSTSAVLRAADGGRVIGAESRLLPIPTAVLTHWFPAREFILLGDGGYASHERARFCHRHRRHVTLVSRFHQDANL